MLYSIVYHFELIFARLNLRKHLHDQGLQHQIGTNHRSKLDPEYDKFFPVVQFFYIVKRVLLASPF